MARVTLAGRASARGSRALGLVLALAVARPLWAADPPASAEAAAPAPPGADLASPEAVPLTLEADPDPASSAASPEAPDGATRASDAPDAEAVQAEAARAAEEAAKAEEKRKRQERIVAFARQRVREIARRKRAEAVALLRAERARQAPAPAKAALPPSPPPPPLPSIVDHRSALERQLAAQWGWGADKDRQVRVPLPDWENRQRVRLFGIEHLAAFRYTKEHHTLTAVFAVESRAQKPSSLTCMDEFERRGFAELKRHSVSIDPIVESSSKWEERPVLVHKTEGRVSFLFSRYEFSAAWTAYPAYEYGCLVYATVVLWDGEAELARRVLDRFVREGVAQVRTLTASVPARQPDAPPVQAPAPRQPTETAQRQP